MLPWDCIHRVASRECDAYHCAIWYEDFGNVAMAEQMYLEALQLPDTMWGKESSIHFEYGMFLRKLRRFDDARRQFKTAIALDE